MKVSVIIPVYEVEKYLETCVDSVLNQSWTDLEVILVDDGSQDDCAAICNRYVRQDERVIAIHQKNRGLSNARNQGIRRATGDYLLFLDGDDFLDDRHGIATLAAQIEYCNCDVLIYHYKKYYENDCEKRERSLAKSKEFGDLQGKTRDNIQGMSDGISQGEWKGEMEPRSEKEQQFAYLITHSRYLASACDKLVRRALFLKYDLYFREGITSEDIDWCARLAIYVESFEVCNCDFYCYRQRPDSISKTLQYQNLLDLTENIKKCLEYAEVFPLSEYLREYYYHYVAYQYGTFFVCCGGVQDRRVKELVWEMKDYRYLFCYDRDPKVKTLHRIYRRFGYSGVCFAGKLYWIVKGTRNTSIFKKEDTK